MPNSLLLAIVFTLAVPSASRVSIDRDPARELIVALRAPTAADDMQAIAQFALRPAVREVADVRAGLSEVLGAGSSFALARRIVRCRITEGVSITDAIRVLGAEPDVEWVEPNAERVPAVWSMSHVERPTACPQTGAPRRTDPHDDAPRSFPNDPLFVDGRQWGLDNRGVAGPYRGVAGADVGAAAAWSRSTGSPDVVLALVDTGIDPAHPELGGEFDGAPRVTALDLAGSGTPLDRHGHGTPVAGVMAARTHDGAHGDSLGVAGVCGGDGTQPGCRILSLKVSAGDRGVTSAFDLAAGVLAATERGARAVNISFAGDLPSRLERLALQHAITHGCVAVVASGNRGFRDGALPQYPAAYSADGWCIQVGASDAWDRRAAFSSYGPGLDFLAPGVDVWTTFPTHPIASGIVHGPYVAASGTSFAAPFATGAIGLLTASRPELCDADFQNLLRATAHDLAPAGRDAESGSGRLDIAAALAAVAPDVGIWHDEAVAREWTDVAADTLLVEQGDFGRLTDGLRTPAHLVRASATIVLPDSFRTPVRVWPRVGGTTTLRDGFRVLAPAPWARVDSVGPRVFRISGYVYVIDRPEEENPAPAAPPGTMLPLPADQVRFGFTVIGPVARSAVARAPEFPAAPEERAAHATARPNPFRDRTLVFAPRARMLEIFDVRGRRVRRIDAGGSVREIAWDGADDSGCPLRPGLYFVRCIPGPSTTLKVLRIE